MPPVNVRILYALGITTLFPKLRDPDSKNGYVSINSNASPYILCCKLFLSIASLPVLGEGSLLCCSPWGFSSFFPVDVSRCVFLYQQEHFYDHQSGSGYLAWRLKTVQRNSAQDSKKSRTTFQEGPKTPRSIRSDEKQLTDDECREAISVMKHSSDTTLVKNKMKATF